MKGNKMKNCNVYLVVLEGGGDEWVGLVNEETWNWIMQGFDSAKTEGYSYNEDVPQELIDAYPKREYQATTVLVTTGSYDNDRALAAPKIDFTSIKKAEQYIKKNNCHLVDEYYGCIY